MTIRTMATIGPVCPLTAVAHTARRRGGPPRVRPWVGRPAPTRLVTGAAGGETRRMGCLLALLALISPRLVLVVLWIFDDVLSRAFDSWILPLLGFFLLPWTTLAYVAFWDWGSGRHVAGF